MMHFPCSGKVSASDPKRTLQNGQIGQQRHHDQHQRAAQSVPAPCLAITIIRSQVHFRAPREVNPTPLFFFLQIRS